MCINCDLCDLLKDKSGDSLFPDTLAMHIMRSVPLLRAIKENVDKGMEDGTPIVYCDPEFFKAFSRLRVLTLAVDVGLKQEQFFDHELTPVDLLTFATLKSFDFHLAPNDKACHIADLEGRKGLISAGKLMVCNLQRTSDKNLVVMQGCIAPVNGIALIQERLKYIKDNNHQFIKLYRLIKSRYGADSLLFLRCLVQELDDYVIRSITSMAWLKSVIHDVGVKGKSHGVAEDLDEQMRLFKSSNFYHATRKFLIHTHGDEIPLDPFSNVSSIKS